MNCDCGKAVLKAPVTSLGQRTQRKVPLEGCRLLSADVVDRQPLGMVKLFCGGGRIISSFLLSMFEMWEHLTGQRWG